MPVNGTKSINPKNGFFLTFIHKEKGMQCSSIKNDGKQCTHRILEGTRCVIHQRKFQITGPNATRKKELDLIHKRLNSEIYERWKVHRDETTKAAEIRAEDIRHRIAKDALIREIQETGQENADDEYIARAIARLEEARVARAARFAQRHLAHARLVVDMERREAPIQRELEAFANDRQNVHTTVVVNAVKTMISKILEIPVPEEYRTENMKTLSEVIDQCQPSMKAVWQMAAKYCNNEDIYDMGPGIYAKVLNSVWQFIKNSEHHEDLKKILASELVDSIGMCAQGNLSRICNVLTGYMDGLDVRSDREILGDKMAQLRDIENVEQRIQVGRALLHNLHIPEEEWIPWLEALE
jgi:hypothetical protein